MQWSKLEGRFALIDEQDVELNSRIYEYTLVYGHVGCRHIILRLMCSAKNNISRLSGMRTSFDISNINVELGVSCRDLSTT